MGLLESLRTIASNSQVMKLLLFRTFYLKKINATKLANPKVS